jgi:uncharacterized protein YutE (UPF0331/DUF86 family)
MSAEADFISEEQKNIEKSLSLITGLIDKDNLSDYETIALGKLLQDVYMGIERILRSLLENRGIKIQKTGRWHKDLLLKAREESLFAEDQFVPLRNLLLFRHLHVHGYGHDLDEKRLRQLAEPVAEICREFLSRIRS